MARKFAQFLIPLLLLSFPLFAADALSKEEILKKILEKAKQNEERVKQFGYYQSTNQKKMKDGKVTKVEARLYRITWIQNQPYLELLKFNGKDLDADGRKKEADRRAKFIKSLSKKDDDDDEITWDDLYVKYDFEQLPQSHHREILGGPSLQHPSRRRESNGRCSIRIRDPGKSREIRNQIHPTDF
jgi:hypothetical protein